jgi:D-glycerate 3-kinase
MDPQQLIALLCQHPWTDHANGISAKDIDTRQPFWPWSLIARALAPALLTRDCRIVSITGSQGSGKSTLARFLVRQLNALGAKTTCVSLDDFYLPKQNRIELARRVHPLLATRGVPGTHDSHRLRLLLEQFASSKGILSISLPQFDKSRDDRVNDVHVDAEVLVLEGWCLGVQPQPAELLKKPVNELERLEDSQGTWRQWCNEQIQQHYQPLWPLVDTWTLLQPPAFAQVIEWRRQQEMDLSPTKGMSEIALQRFIQHYERLTRWQWLQPVIGQRLAIDLTAEHDIAAIRPLIHTD